MFTESSTQNSPQAESLPARQEDRDSISSRFPRTPHLSRLGVTPANWLEMDQVQGGPLVSEEGWFDMLPPFQPAMGSFEGLPEDEQ